MPSSPRTILYIDPIAERRLSTAGQLLEHGLNVLLAADLATAQALVRHHRPAVVVLDAELLSHRDLREKLYIHGLPIDVPFVVFADDREPLASTSVPYGVISRPLTNAGIHSLLAIQGLPVAGEAPVISSQPPPATSTSLLYALPHEYRTPLTDIIGSVSYLHGHAETLAPSDIRDLTAEVLSAARRLLRTTDNFLVYAQIETLVESPMHIQRMRMCTTPEPAGVMYDAAVSRAMAHQRTADLALALDIEGMGVNMLEQHLTKVTSELIDNALYFSRPGTTVSVQAVPTDTDVVITIRDHGVGMAQQEVEHIGAYQQFRRHTQEQQGVGLGLVIAKRLVEIHGGTFTVTSAMGLGTSITFTIPRAA